MRHLWTLALFLASYASAQDAQEVAACALSGVTCPQPMPLGTGIQPLPSDLVNILRPQKIDPCLQGPALNFGRSMGANMYSGQTATAQITVDGGRTMISVNNGVNSFGPSVTANMKALGTQNPVFLQQSDLNSIRYNNGLAPQDGPNGVCPYRHCAEGATAVELAKKGTDINSATSVNVIAKKNSDGTVSVSARNPCPNCKGNAMDYGSVQTAVANGRGAMQTARSWYDLNRGNLCNAAPSMAMNGLFYGALGFEGGTTVANQFTDNPWLVYGTGSVAATWTGVMGLEAGYLTATGLNLLPAAVSPTSLTGTALVRAGPYGVIAAEVAFLGWEIYDINQSMNAIQEAEAKNEAMNDQLERMTGHRPVDTYDGPGVVSQYFHYANPWNWTW